VSIFVSIIVIYSFTGCVYVLITMLIILLWCFTVKWSKQQEAAKRSCNVLYMVTACVLHVNQFQLYYSVIF